MATIYKSKLPAVVNDQYEIPMFLYADEKWYDDSNLFTDSTDIYFEGKNEAEFYTAVKDFFIEKLGADFTNLPFSIPTAPEQDNYVIKSIFPNSYDLPLSSTTHISLTGQADIIKYDGQSIWSFSPANRMTKYNMVANYNPDATKYNFLRLMYADTHYYRQIHMPFFGFTNAFRVYESSQYNTPYDLPAFDNGTNVIPVINPAYIANNKIDPTTFVSSLNYPVISFYGSPIQSSQTGGIIGCHYTINVSKMLPYPATSGSDYFYISAYSEKDSWGVIEWEELVASHIDHKVNNTIGEIDNKPSYTIEDWLIPVDTDSTEGMYHVVATWDPTKLELYFSDRTNIRGSQLGVAEFRIDPFESGKAQSTTFTLRLKDNVKLGDELLIDIGAAATGEGDPKVIPYFLQVNLLEEHKEYDPSEDPYKDIEESESGGGDGTLDWTSDDVEFDATTPEPVGPSYVSTGGLMNVYALKTNINTTMRALKGILKPSWVGDQLVYSLQDLKDCIVSLYNLPINVNTTGDDEIIELGNQKLQDVQLSLTEHIDGVGQRITSYFQTIDLGEINLKEFYGSYLDYAPHTEVSIYLPFIGIRNIDINEVMDKTLHLYYKFCVLDGTCVATLTADGNVICQWNGQCSIEYPLTATDKTSILTGILQTVGGISSIAVGGPAGVGMGVSQLAQGVSNMAQTQVQRNGNFSSSFGWMSHRTPYLIIKSPRLARPKDKASIIGQKRITTAKVSDLKGYTAFDYIHIDIPDATDAEKDEIERLMMEGVIL